MFTGIIESLGEIIDNQQIQNGQRLRIKSKFINVQEGESIAVNGVCLTALPEDNETIQFDMSAETLSITTLGRLVAGEVVNLERAMQVGSRFGGHYVSGHVDTTASILSIKPNGDFVEIVVGEFGMIASAYLWPKGSITLDGVSLTINEVDGEQIKLMLIPHTLSVTTLGKFKPSQIINIEFDYFARVIAHQLKMMKQYSPAGLILEDIL